MNKIAIIGGGNLGTAIALGLLKSRYCKPTDITITKRNVDTLKHLAKKGMQVTSNNEQAIKENKIVILAVKPFQVGEILQQTKSFFREDHLIISVITGVTIQEIKTIVTVDASIFRAMPNTAIAIQQSMTCISGENKDDDQKQIVISLFDKLGKTVFIQENLMDASTVLGACGTAFAMRFIRANIQGGIEIGFDSKTANLIAAQTIKGAAELLLQNGTHPEQEIDKVTTPKGCTIAGLNEMEHQGFSSSIIKGIAASFQKITKA